MKIREKISAILDGTLAHDLVISHDEIAKYKIRESKTLIGLLFEEQCSMGSSFMPDGGAVSFLGAFSYMNSGGYIRGNVFIGRFCSIGRRVTIGAGMHSMSGVSTSPVFPGRAVGRRYTAEEAKTVRINRKRPPTIVENDVWVGDGAVIMPGVRIGTGSVIGANSVVTRDVDPYTIVGGSPARVIGRRFDKALSDKLLETEYWDLPHDVLSQAPGGNVFDFIEHLNGVTRDVVDYKTIRLKPSSTR